MALEPETIAYVARVFVLHPLVDTLYLSGDDGQLFFTENMALLHIVPNSLGAPEAMERATFADDIIVAQSAIGVELNSDLTKAAVLSDTQTDAVAASAATHAAAVTALGIALGSAEYTGIDDPFELSPGIELSIEQLTVGAWQRSGLTQAAWNALDTPTRETAVVDHALLLQQAL